MQKTVLKVENNRLETALAVHRVPDFSVQLVGVVFFFVVAEIFLLLIPTSWAMPLPAQFNRDEVVLECSDSRRVRVPVKIFLKPGQGVSCKADTATG